MEATASACRDAIAYADSLQRFKVLSHTATPAALADSNAPFPVSTCAKASQGRAIHRSRPLLGSCDVGQLTLETASKTGQGLQSATVAGQSKGSGAQSRDLPEADEGTKLEAV